MALTSACSHKRKLALPKEAEHWSLTTLREKLVKIGAKVGAQPHAGGEESAREDPARRKAYTPYQKATL